MLLRHLELQHYRNYAHLDVSFAPGLVLVQGANAQGKTNLLEVIYLLAATKSTRARSDGELVSYTDRDPLSQFGFARIVARIERAGTVNTLEVVVREGNVEGQARKRFKLNGAERRAGDILGRVNAVFFSPTDVDLVDGAPVVRRRYLDVMLCQVDAGYVRALTQYNRVILQRNALLRQIRDRRQTRQALDYWDTALCDQGALIVAARATALRTLAQVAATRHLDLSGGSEHLAIVYRPAMPELPEPGELAQGGPAAARLWLQRGLEILADREVQAGVSLLGPHRDDLSFAINDKDANAYGSRGQQRTVTLALKLAELAYMQAITAEQPILLLDDATSELDERRRAAIFAAAATVEQTFITSADDHVFAAQTANAQRWSVEAGSLRPLP